MLRVIAPAQVRFIVYFAHWYHLRNEETLCGDTEKRIETCMRAEAVMTLAMEFTET